jgi:hypothetical protein
MDALPSSFGSATLSEVRGSNVYGNPSGFEIIDRLTKLEDTVQELKNACFGYLRIRRRFLAQFQPKDLKYEDPWYMMKEGNEAAHHGDAVTDAGLCQSSEMVNLMIKIYGLTPADVLHLCKY